MDDAFDATYFTITDEDGVDYEMEILDEVEVDGQLYYAMVAAQEDPEQESEEVVILKVTQEDGEDVLVTPEDDAEAEKVFQIFMDRLYEDDGEEAPEEN